MNILGIILVLAMVIICYKIYSDRQSNENTEIKTSEQFVENIVANPKNTGVVKSLKKQRRSSKSMTKDVSKYLDKMMNFNNKNKADSFQTAVVNPYFQEIQFHQDYRDTMNAFGLMCDQKNIFNKTHEPLLKSDPVENKEITKLVETFIQALNFNVKNNVGDVATEKLNSWADNMPPITANNNIIKKKASWEQYNEELGLPPSIYPEPATRGKINLVKIDGVNKYETTKELKYTVYLILQKENTTDQMVVKISFVIDKEDVNLEREFFDKNKNNFETKIIIEEISIIGFMITKGVGKPRTQREKFYDYEGFSDGRLISEKDVIKQLNDKRREIEKDFVSHM